MSPPDNVSPSTGRDACFLNGIRNQSESGTNRDQEPISTCPDRRIELLVPETTPTAITELASEEGLAAQKHQPVGAPDQRQPNSPYRPSRPMLPV